MARDNRSLGRFHLDGIPPAPRGVPQIEVTFDIDANGILTVTARDKATGKQQDIRITASSGLSKEEIERMKREAQEHAAEDKKRREEIELRNQADQLVYQTDKQLQELGDKLPAEHRSRIEQAKERLSDAIKNNVADIRPAMDALTKAWNDASAVMYQSTAGATSASGGGSAASDGGGSASSTPGVEDAEFTVVDDK
jgi:molecular chaperone DnaK